MPDRIATIDTSALISLKAADLLGAISVLFDCVLVPIKVREELRTGHRRYRSILNELERYAIFRNCDQYDIALVQLLLQTRKYLRVGRDQGEAEAVIQAASLAATMTLIDDRLGRQWAEQHSLECHGSIWVCQELRRTGYIPKMRGRFIRMLLSGRHQPAQEMNRILGQFGEGTMPNWFITVTRWCSRLHL